MKWLGLIFGVFWGSQLGIALGAGLTIDLFGQLGSARAFVIIVLFAVIPWAIFDVFRANVLIDHKSLEQMTAEIAGVPGVSFCGRAAGSVVCA